MKARAACILRNGDVDFIVELQSCSTFSDAMEKLRKGVLYEFDHSFEADEWFAVNILIQRDR